jgi:hypothetical protein
VEEGGEEGKRVKHLHGVHVWAYVQNNRTLLWCSVCGPMGVTEGQPDAIMIKDHIREHGCEERP